jgi:PhoH-like ATPase
MSYDRIYVLDTNIILNDAQNLYNISQNGDNLIVLPETVIDEIDTKKTGFDEINFQAREFGRILSQAEVTNTTRDGDDVIMSVKINDTLLIDIISLKDYGLKDVDRSIINDRKIIEVAKFSGNYYNKKEDTILLSLDVMCRTRAISLNVKTESLDFKKKDRDYNFIKEFDIDSTLLNSLHLKNIRDIDPDYTSENYCYFFKGDNGHNVPAFIINEQINIIEENELRKNTIKPKNLGQQYAMSGMLDTRFNLCLIEALAGSGKTLLALGCAMREIDLGHYDKIIYIRNSIESVDKGEDIGYLSGNEEKFKIYNYPLYDTLDFIARQSIKKKENVDNEESIVSKIEELISKYHIDTMWVGAIRGRTISNAYVIVDEVQNFSAKSLQTVLSRLDDQCKVVCIGSNRQIDNQWVNKYTNGLSILLEETENPHEEINMFATKLDKVVRGKITQWTERVFTKK